MRNGTCKKHHMGFAVCPSVLGLGYGFYIIQVYVDGIEGVEVFIFCPARCWTTGITQGGSHVHVVTGLDILRDGISGSAIQFIGIELPRIDPATILALDDGCDLHLSVAVFTGVAKQQFEVLPYALIRGATFWR